MQAIDINAVIGRRHGDEARVGRAALAADLDRHGVALAVAHHEMAVHYSMEAGNRLAYDAADEHPCLLPAAVLDPRDALRWPAEAADALRRGVRVFRFFPLTHYCSVRSQVFGDMLEALRGSGAVAMVPAPDCLHEGGALQALADRTRQAGLPLILSELPYFSLAEIIAVMRAFPHVYAETNWLATVGAVDLLAATLGSDRLLYGSAAPARPMQKALNQVLEALLCDADKGAILGGNARRLLALDAAGFDGRPDIPGLEPQGFDGPIVDVHSHLGHWPFPMRQEDDAPAGMLERMRRYGITHSVVSSYETMRYDIAAGNRRLAEAIAGHPELLGYVEVNPLQFDLSCAEMDRYFQLPNVVGVEVELNHIPAPTGGGKVRKLMAEIARRGRPVLFMPHSTGDASAERDLAREWPNLPIIHAHGFDADWAATVADTPNIHVEFSWSRPSHHDLRDALDILGPERVLFGSDQTLLSPGAAVGLYRDARMTRRESGLVLSQNARRLFGAGMR